MDFWFETEIRARRDDALAAASRFRRARLCESGRSIGVRTHLADGAQALSDGLAHLATLLRPGAR